MYQNTGSGAVAGGFEDGTSVVGATWLNMITDELLALVNGAGITPSPADQTQVLQAVQALASSLVTGLVTLDWTAGNQYVQIGPLLIRTGMTDPITSSITTGTVTFPLAGPDFGAVPVVLLTAHRTSEVPIVSISLDPTITGFDWFWADSEQASSSSGRIRWLAFGPVA